MALNGETALVTGAPARNRRGDRRWIGIIASYAPLLVFFVALVPRLADLGRRPFWFDEMLTALRAAMPVPVLISQSLRMHHTPVYFLLMAPLAHLPHPEFWLRLPSAILGALSVMLVFLIARRTGGTASGIAAALILGLSPTEIAFSQEARSYMLMIFCILVALHGLTGLAQSGKRASMPWRSGGAGWLWLQFIAGSTAAFCTLGDSLPWLLAAAVTAGIMIARAQNRSGLLRNLSLAFAIPLACCLPIYLMMPYMSVRNLPHFAAPTAAIIWYDIESVYLMRISDFISRHFMAVPTPQALTIGIGAGLVLAAMAGIWHLRRDPALAALLPAALLLPILSAIVSPFVPIVTARYLLWSASPFVVLAGIGIGTALDKTSARIRYAALAVVAVMLLGNLLPFYGAETKPRWDLAARLYAAKAGQNDVAYFCDPGGELALRYYLPAQLQPQRLLYFADNLQQAEQARAQGKQLWAIYGDAWNLPVWTSLAEFQSSLAPLGAPSAEIHVGRRIIMWRFDAAKK